MIKVKTTELEFKGPIQSWLNEIIKATTSFEEATPDFSLKSGDRTVFPDLVIWINRGAGQAFINWEFKGPEIPADDPELIKGALEKAYALNTKYFITYNLSEAYLWKIPESKEEAPSLVRPEPYRPKCTISSREDFQDKSKQARIKEMLREIVFDLVKLYRDDSLSDYPPDIFFVNKLSECAKAIAPHLKTKLAESARDRNFSQKLTSWANKQGIANFGDEASYNILSRQMAYRLLGRILFYLTLRRFRPDLPEFHLQKVPDFSRRIQEYFAKALRIDYQGVFEKDLPDEIDLPKDIQGPLVKLVKDLNQYDFSALPQEIIGSVFEKLIPPDERHNLGQYFTNENLVDLILALCLRAANDKILDPTCGSGTFLIRAYDWFKFKGLRNHKELLPKIWGIDIARFPAELATINLYRQDLSDYENFPRIIVKDFFELKPEQEFGFPPPKPSDDPEYKIKEKMPLFDCAVGNFPYIRQELIEKTNKGYKAELERILAQDWASDYRELFKNGGQLRLSGQADIYAYLFFHTAKFILPDGRMGFVTSNSWLDVAYGFELQKFFLKKFKLIAILESRCEPWFEDAAVNTIITILERCENKQARDEHFVKFVKIKKKLAELIPWDIKDQPDDRWKGLARLAKKIELADQKAKPLSKNIMVYEDDEFRIRMLKQKELLEELESSGQTVKWGKYLRAPDVYFEILEKCKDKLVPLKEIAEVRRGFTTGINEFFYLDEEKIKQWKIEEEFLKPVIKSPKEADKILIDPSKLKFRIFMCNKSKQELKKEKKFGALKYIEWGEKQKTEEGVPWPEVPSVSSRKYWWGISDKSPASCVWLESFGDRLITLKNVKDIYCDKRFYEIAPKKDSCEILLSALLNSSLLWIQNELTGRINMGDGVLDTVVFEVENMMVAKLIDKNIEQRIAKTFNQISNRPIKDIFNEIRQKDRRELDSLVLASLGLDRNKYLNRIYDGLVELVRERIELARMRKKVKEIKSKRDINRLKEQIIEEFEAEINRKFPEAFLDKKYLREPEAREITISNHPLRMGKTFMDIYPVIADDGFKYEARDLSEAKFIIYSQKPDSLMVKLPKDKLILQKAVKDYEDHIKTLSHNIFSSLIKHTSDHKLSDRLTADILEEVGMRKAIIKKDGGQV